MGRPRTDIAPRIVQAARARFLKEGVDGASLREIAAGAETSLGMIHYYFKSKDDLFFAVVEDVYAKLLADLEVAFAPDAPVRERFLRAFRRFGEASEQEIEVLRLVIQEALVSSARFDRLIVRFRGGHLPFVLRTLADGIAAGDIDGEAPLPVLMLSVAGMAIVPQLIRRAFGDAPPFTGIAKGEELARMTLDLLFRGIGARGAPGERPRARGKKRG